jgi:asparagine synthase (glutamine-hydrolysing)
LPAEARTALAAGVNALPVSHEYVSLDFKLRQFLRGTGHTAETDFFYWMGAFTEEEKKALLAREIPGNAFDDVSLLSAARRSESDVQRCLYLCAKLYLQDGVLVKVDRASMANSLEVRAPYLDHDLVEFAARCPLEHKMTMWRTKLVLRQAAKNLLPAAIVRQRKKRGFGVPIGGWISGSLKDLFHEYLKPERLKRDGLFEPGCVERLLSDHVARRRNNWKLLWTLLVFQLWKEQWHTSGR